jgi:hypothetical protein
MRKRIVAGKRNAKGRGLLSKTFQPVHAKVETSGRSRKILWNPLNVNPNPWASMGRHRRKANVETGLPLRGPGCFFIFRLFKTNQPCAADRDAK